MIPSPPGQIWAEKFWELGEEGRHCKSGFCKKLQEGFPVSDRGNVSQLQDRRALSRAEPIRDGNNAYLRRGKHYCANAIVTRAERRENM